MPHTVEAVEEHGESEEALKRDLGRDRPSSDRRNHAGRLEMPSRVRRSEVGKTKEVQRAGKRDAGDAVERRGVPGDLRLVDGEVGRDGAVEALLYKDFGGRILGCGLRGCESGSSISTAWTRMDMFSAGAASCKGAGPGRRLPRYSCDATERFERLSAVSSGEGSVLLCGVWRGPAVRRTSSWRRGRRAGP